MKRIVLLLSTLHLALGTSYADTTWVSGAVSGEWTRDGNPYIVVDSTWVPEGERLTITRGSEVQFREGQGLYVWGTFFVNGFDDDNAWEDSVLFYLSPGVEHWKGLRFYGRNEAVFNYATIRGIGLREGYRPQGVGCPDTAIFIDEGYSLTLNHTTLNAARRAIRPINNSEVGRNWRLTFSYSEVSGGLNLQTEGGTIYAEHSIINFGRGEGDEYVGRNPGFNGTGTIYEFRHSIIYGSVGIMGGYCTVDHCQFLEANNADQPLGISLGEQGWMKNSLVEGSCSVFLAENRPFVNNRILSFVGLHGSGVMSDCIIDEGLGIGSGDSITVRNSMIGQGISMNNIRSVVIDSCVIAWNQDGNEQVSFSVDNGTFYLSRSILRSHIHFSGLNYAAVINQNTFVLDSINNGGAIDVSSNVGPLITNNIFLNLFGDFEESRLISHSPFDDNDMPIFKYNCLWGFDHFEGEPDSGLINLDPSNIVANPELEFFGFSVNLSPDSPCIDRGDPDAPRDPDGTQADLGARYFHQPRFVSATDPPRLAVLLTAFPNPFNSSTTISYSLPKPGRYAIDVIDIQGRLVTRLSDGWREAGSYWEVLNGGKLTSGKYLVSMHADKSSATIPIIIVK